MPRLLPFVSFLSVALSVTTLGAQGFEGTLRMRTISIDATPVLEQQGHDRQRLIALPWQRVLAAAIDAGAQAEEDTTLYQIKGSRVRMSGVGMGEGSYMVADQQSGTLLIVQPEQRSYVEWTRADMREMLEQMRAMAADSAATGAAELESLGTTREVRGRRCADYRIEEEQSITIACVAADLTALAALFQKLSEIMGDPTGSEGKALTELTRHGFPLLIRELTTEGDPETMSAQYEITELMAIDRGPVPDGVFAAPPGFTKTAPPGRP